MLCSPLATLCHQLPRCAPRIGPLLHSPVAISPSFAVTVRACMHQWLARALAQGRDADAAHLTPSIPASSLARGSAAALEPSRRRRPSGLVMTLRAACPGWPGCRLGTAHWRLASGVWASGRPFPDAESDPPRATLHDAIGLRVEVLRRGPRIAPSDDGGRRTAARQRRPGHRVSACSSACREGGWNPEICLSLRAASWRQRTLPPSLSWHSCRHSLGQPGPER